jgi:uncharacterized protein YkwD
MNFRIILFSLLLIASFTACEVEEFTPSVKEQDLVEEKSDAPGDMTQMISLVNRLRSEGCQCGSNYMPPVAPLSWDGDLEQAALRHALDMQTNDFFDHTGSDGTSVSDRVSATGYQWQTVGENIAWGYRSIDAVFAGWKDSPGHCRNMMNANFREIGSARVGNYWVQAFGRTRGN